MAVKDTGAGTGIVAFKERRNNMCFTNFKMIEFPKEAIEKLRQNRMEEILNCGVKPVCANCDELIDLGGPILSCKVRGGIIPREVSDNLTCVRNCSRKPDFKPRDTSNL